MVISINDYYSQDTISLKTIDVITLKENISQIGKKIEPIDSIIKQQFKFNSVADLLNLNSSIFIKNYGPGGLSSSAFRGGNASQTAILWNGLNIQNAMLGQCDLTLMPNLLFENIQIEYGGSSSLWGSGAVGGSIHLNNNLEFNKGLHINTNIGSGSFGLFNFASDVLLSKKRFATSIKFYRTSSENNFPFNDPIDKTSVLKVQKNADYNFNGLMQEFKILINPKQIFTINTWLNYNQRNLPSYYESNQKKRQQLDISSRIIANWVYFKSKISCSIKAAIFNDFINYNDSSAEIFSKSKSQTILIENENFYNWKRHHNFYFGINMSNNQAFIKNYESIKYLNKASFLIGNKFSFLNGKLISNVSARVEYFSVGTLPVTGGAAFEYRLFKPITIIFNAAKVYRQPTLNELYWMPGGNNNLKAEQGYTFEGGANYKKQLKDFLFQFTGAIYSREIENWILWIPSQNGSSSAINIQKVWSRGSETTLKLNYQKNKIKLGSSIMTSYVLSTIQSSQQENNNTLNKQLIYTPRYLLNANLSVGLHNIYFIFYHQYFGYRFTTSDNSQWLNPYQVSSCRFNYTFDVKKINLSVYGSCNNMFNQNYYVLAGRPMPLRSYEFGITIKSI